MERGAGVFRAGRDVQGWFEEQVFSELGGYEVILEAEML